MRRSQRWGRVEKGKRHNPEASSICEVMKEDFIDWFGLDILEHFKNYCLLTVYFRIEQVPVGTTMRPGSGLVVAEEEVDVMVVDTLMVFLRLLVEF